MQIVRNMLFFVFNTLFSYTPHFPNLQIGVQRYNKKSKYASIVALFVKNYKKSVSYHGTHFLYMWLAVLCKIFFIYLD